MQDRIACNFARNIGLPLSGAEKDTPPTLTDIHKANHVYKCRCQRDIYFFKDECYVGETK